MLRQIGSKLIGHRISSFLMGVMYYVLFYYGVCTRATARVAPTISVIVGATLAVALALVVVLALRPFFFSPVYLLWCISSRTAASSRRTRSLFAASACTFSQPCIMVLWSRPPSALPI